MPSKNVTDPDWSTFDSRVIFRADGTRREYIERDDRDEYPDTRMDDRLFEVEGALVCEMEIRNSMTNVDAFFDPDYEVFRHEYDQGLVEFHSEQRGPPERHFDCYSDEIRAGAYQRAVEDVSHEVNVLAGWLYQAAGKDFVTSGARPFYNALRVALDDYEDPPEWAICYDGDPERTFADGPFITTLEGADAYASGVIYQDAIVEDDDE